MSIITVEENVVHYEAIGHGKPVIFVHGWLGSWRYWWFTMQALSNVCRAFAVDLWGFGDSSKSPSHYRLESYVTLLESFRQRLGITQQITFVGHSLGAAVVLKYATENPESVKRIIVVSPPDDIAFVNDALGSSLDATIVARQLNLNSQHQVILSEIPRTDTLVIPSTIEQLKNYSLAESIREVQCPVLLVDGERDPVVGDRSHKLDRLFDLSQQVNSIKLDRSEHFPMIEQPAVFNRLLKEFIQGRDLSAITPKDYWKRRTR